MFCGGDTGGGVSLTVYNGGMERWYLLDDNILQLQWWIGGNGYRNAGGGARWSNTALIRTAPRTGIIDSTTTAPGLSVDS